MPPNESNRGGAKKKYMQIDIYFCIKQMHQDLCDRWKEQTRFFRSKYQFADCRMHFTYKIRISGQNFAIKDNFKRSIGFLLSFFRKHEIVC